jgi:hypothetical protein
LNLANQIAHAQGLLSNAKRMEELITKRATLQEQIAEVETELQQLLGNPPTTSGRAPQRCKNCGETGHNSKRCPNPPKGAE